MAKLSWANIPSEFARTGAWAISTLKPILDASGNPVIRGGKPVVDKAPRHPLTLALLDMNDPGSWATFEQCISSPHPAIGRLLQHGDGFTVIDLDAIPEEIMDPEQIAMVKDFQLEIYANFDSYAERSQSGSGCHIIIKGHLSGGYRQPGFEVYGHQRYMITTGDVIRDRAITEYQTNLNSLAAFMESRRTDYGLPADEDDDRTPEDIITLACSAKNNEKFKRLFYDTPSDSDNRSELDASLAQIIAFYTKSHRLAVEVFARSAQWRGDGSMEKKRGYERPDKYVHDYLLGRTFARAWNLRAADVAEEEEMFKLGEAIANGFLDQHRREQEEASDGSPPEVDQAPTSVPWPGGGTLRRLADYFMSNALRPVPEIALAGAITFYAGIVGRQFNISGSGLNQYIVLAAGTGRGKEGAASGIDAMVRALEKVDPSIQEFAGPGHIASGQGLIRTMSEQSSLWSVLGEFGHTLKIITDPKANAADRRTRQVLLDLFGKSGAGRKLYSSAYSDAEKNTKVVEAPNFCVLGETTPDMFFRAFDTDLVAEGFLPRFTVLLYEGPRVKRNPTANQAPPQELVQEMAVLLRRIQELKYSNTFVNIPATPDAQSMLNAFDKECDNNINRPSFKEAAEMWNRAHLKVLRLAALAAVGDADHSGGQTPLVQPWHVQWAMALVRGDLQRVEGRISAGEVGEGEVKFESHIVRLVKEYLTMTPEKRASYSTPSSLVNEPTLIPFAYLRRRLRRIQEFNTHRLGVKKAIDDAVADAVRGGVLCVASEESLKGKGLRGGDVFTTGSSFR